MDTLNHPHVGYARHEITQHNLVNLIYSQAYITFSFPVVTGFCLVLLLRSVSTLSVLIAWYAVICLHAVMRYLLLWHYHRCRLCPETANSWLNRFAVSVFFSGVFWGMAPVILVPRSEGIEFILFNGLTVLVVCGLVSGALISYAISPRVLFAYTFPALIPPAVYLISLGDLHNSSLGGYVLLYYLFITIAAARINHVFLQFVEMEQQKTELYYRYEKLKSIYSSYRRKIGV